MSYFFSKSLWLSKIFIFLYVFGFHVRLLEKVCSPRHLAMNGKHLQSSLGTTGSGQCPGLHEASRHLFLGFVAENRPPKPFSHVQFCHRRVDMDKIFPAWSLCSLQM